ncbi:short chain dehydrogenase [Salipaludibacillus neizhouensis]|uniref:Short chain dehydrogenase n=1 Tax=Salipaludibacillus neizhouensis TaxID=885475 RepID=A0A3A9KJE5_9BACI|nr:NAD-dependent epimerase/dehydratase family protein [Salipaludibacillus neizhouensis]RKL67875.1 short chain dehydrogenase [Salipaludibacillus neizhouensis]
MKKALVLGASGSMGTVLVKELASRRIEVIAFARGREKLEVLFRDEPLVTICKGDVLKQEELAEAAKGVDVIFQSVNIPYQEWKEKLPLITKNVILTAENCSAKLAVVDNIYAYGRQPNIKVTEETNKKPHTKKGKLRLDMETEYMNSSVPTMIVHFPDFYGPHAEGTLLDQTISKVADNKSGIYIGHQKLPREFIYTPDGAKAMVELTLRESSYNQQWNIPATHPVTGQKLIQILREITGYKKSVSTVGKPMIQFLGLFQPLMKEMVEMMYLNQEPVILSGEKYRNNIGNIPRTSYEQGLKETLEWKRNRNIL